LAPSKTPPGASRVVLFPMSTADLDARLFLSSSGE
jgi:hypothetical protein